jgi:hypothetical protein
MHLYLRRDENQAVAITVAGPRDFLVAHATVLPLLNTRPDINLKRETALALLVQAPIRLGNILWVDLSLRSQMHTIVSTSWNIDWAIDVCPDSIGQPKAEFRASRGLGADGLEPRQLSTRCQECFKDSGDLVRI